MDTREAACSCGQLTIEADGDPVQVVACHCLACQRRTGSALSVQALFPRERARMKGQASEFRRANDKDGEGRNYHFCPECGGTVYYFLESLPDIVLVPVGGFADPGFQEPGLSIWEARRHAWVTLPSGIEHSQ
jgi:hypothetical protein